MSFDIYLERLVAGESAPVDRARVLAVLRQHCAESAGPDGRYDVHFRDGLQVEFAARNLESAGEFTGCAFFMRGFSPLVLGFVFDVAVAGDMVIFNAQGADTPDNPLAILVDPAQQLHLPSATAANPVFCASASRLAELLGVGISDWTAFRDSATGRSGAS